MSLFNSLIDWTNSTFKPYGSLGLFTLAFTEASFFPIPPDLLLITLSLADPSLALWFALITTIGSTLGGVFGYLIGYIGEHAILEKFFSPKKIEKVHNLFNKYEAWAIFIAGFTPIPYKVFTIAAGVFYVNLKKFIIASFFSRGLRFFLEAVLIIVYGDFILDFLTKYFDILSIIGIILLIIIIVIYKRFFPITFYRKKAL